MSNIISLSHPSFLHSRFYKKLTSVYNDFLLMKRTSYILPKLRTVVSIKPINVFPTYNVSIKAAAVYAGIAHASQHLRDYIHIWVSIQLMISALPKKNPLYVHIKILSKSPNLYPILKTSYLL